MIKFWDIVWAAALVVLGGAIWSGWMTYTTNKGKRLTRWPLLGMLPAMLANTHHYYDWLTNILVLNGGTYKLYGPKFSNANFFVTTLPRNLEYALVDNFSNFPKGRYFTEIFHDLLGHGIFNADDDTWHVQRKNASVHLNSGAHRRFSDATVISSVKAKLLPVLQNLSTRGVHVDLHDLMLRFTFDTICHVGFGVDTGCLTPDLPTVPFAAAFEHALDCATLRTMLPETWWKLMRRLKIGKEKDMPAALQVIDGFVTGVIAARRKELKAAGRSDLLSSFMNLRTEDSHDDKYLKDMCVNFLLAGRDTSAQALSWFFWLLATHPDKEAKVVEEIDGVMDSTNGVLSREILSRMSYLHAALSESLRLYPSVPIDIKNVRQDDVLPDGNRVYKGETFVYNIYAMGRMVTIWGSDCREFRPERWFDAANSGQLVHVSPFQFPAFNAGPRLCLGKDLAYFLMKAVACTLLHSFKIVLVPGHVVEPKFSITLYMKHGLLVSLLPRQKS